MIGQYPVPILFLTFNRPDTTQLVFDQIKKVRPKFLYVAGDGARKGVNGELEKVKITKSIIEQVDWDCEIKTLFRDENLGCKYAVSSAITWFFNNVDEGVILEDDCLPDLTFFYYCQEMLARYRNNHDIYLIGGNYYKSIMSISTSYFFSYYSHIWGWASWKRVWDRYDVEITEYKKDQINKQPFTDIFNFKSEKKYWAKIFSKLKANQINTWDYQFAYLIFKNKGISINPTKNLVINIGLNNNSTHFFLKDTVKTSLKMEMLDFPLIHPSKIEINREADRFTYLNLIAHSPTRIFRIFKENGVFDIVKYLYYRLK